MIGPSFCMPARDENFYQMGLKQGALRVRITFMVLIGDIGSRKYCAKLCREDCLLAHSVEWHFQLLNKNIM